MNLIEPIDGIPDWEFSDHSTTEIMLNGREMVAESDYILRVGKAAICGFIYTTLVNPPWFWFALAKNVTIGDLNDFRRCIRYIPKGSLTAVAADFPKGLRFAKLYGFEETGEEQDFFGRRYLIMRKL